MDRKLRSILIFLGLIRVIPRRCFHTDALLGTLDTELMILPVCERRVIGKLVAYTTARSTTALWGPLTCVFAAVPCPEGAVIQQDGGPKQMCARVLDAAVATKTSPPRYTAPWIHTSKAIRERGKNIIRLPQPPPTVCAPKPSTQSSHCSCEEGSYSRNSVVDSANGKLSCNEGKWVPISAIQVEKKK